MQISKNKVATFDFTVTGESGEILDSSEKNGPFPYVHGIGYLVPGLEAAMEGKSAGDKFNITILPAQAYGERDESLVLSVPISKLQGVGELNLGTLVKVGIPEGEMVTEITEITDEGVTLDGNHPLAGRTLNFDVSVVDVRDASPEELSHGHPIVDGFTHDCGSCQDDFPGDGGCGCGNHGCH